VACSGLRLVLFIFQARRSNNVPFVSDWVVDLKVGVAESRVARSSKQNELVFNVSKAHSCSWTRFFRFNDDFCPDHRLDVEKKEVVESL